MVDPHRTARALSFGQAAERYDRYRPGYPAQLVADVLALGAGGRVLEAGAGTGRATRELARRGATVVAVEPDPAMAELARQNTGGLSVRVEQCPFEDHQPAPGGFDLVVSAQAWHWIDRAGGSAVARRALGPGGVLALWWNQAGELQGPVWEAIHAAYARHAPELGRHNLSCVLPEHDTIADPAEGFGPWTRRVYDWSVTYDAESYRGLISTHSNHLGLPPARRERLLAAVRDAVLTTGNQVPYPYRTLLLSAPAQAATAA